MSTSDSDGFESAEEDFEQVRPTLVIPNVKKVVEDCFPFQGENNTSLRQHIYSEPSCLEGWELDDDLNSADDNISLDSTSTTKGESQSCTTVSSGQMHSKLKVDPSDVYGINSSNDNSTTQLWTWKYWGVVSELSSATQNACSFTSNIRHESNKVTEGTQSPSGGSSSSVIGGLFGGVTQLGNKFINTGLDTLESLGKKTMQVLQEGDPGLKKKRALLFNEDQPLLSQVLKEACANEGNEEERSKPITRDASFETVFDDLHGLVHLEALEMVSQQSNLKLNKFLSECDNPNTCEEYMDTIQKVEEAYSLYGDEDDEGIDPSNFSKRLNNALRSLETYISIDKLIDMSNRISSENNKHGDQTVSDVHKLAIYSLAEFTAMSIETIHRLTENVMLKQPRKPDIECDTTLEIAKLLIMRVNSIGNNYTSKLMTLENSSAVMTNIFLEVDNASAYIQRAYKCCLAVLKVAVLKM